MFIGHLPGAYLLSSAFAPRTTSPAVLAAFLVGSVIPDLDMLWFTFVDSSVHHHHLITHRPALWGCIGAAGLVLRWPWLVALALGAIVHCALDTIAGDIMWLWPFSREGFQAVVVPATHDHWIKSFLAHWTFKVEILICLVAATVFWKRNRPGV